MSIFTPPPRSLAANTQGGSGVALDWTRLRGPDYASNGWLLAGGLTPDNVAQAVQLAHPTVVDVSSGVCGPDGEWVAEGQGRLLRRATANLQG